MSETIPWWLAEASPKPLPRRPLGGPPDVEVIGGGVTGCACVLALAEGGLRVRLYEARSIAGGASGRNGGFALGGGAMRYDVARETFGREAAREYWLLTAEYLDRLELLAGDALTRPGSLRLAADDEELEQLRLEHAALREDGFDAEWRSAEALSPELRGGFLGGIFHPHDGSLQPARFVLELAGRAIEAGVEVCEGTRVESLAGREAAQVGVATVGPSRGAPPAIRDTATSSACCAASSAPGRSWVARTRSSSSATPAGSSAPHLRSLRAVPSPLARADVRLEGTRRPRAAGRADADRRQGGALTSPVTTERVSAAGAKGRTSAGRARPPAPVRRQQSRDPGSPGRWSRRLSPRRRSSDPRRLP